jgi:hypothetical protein
MRPFEIGLVLPMGEVVVWPPTVAAVDAMAPVLELLDAG